MKGIIMMRVKYLLIITVVLSAIIMFTGCQKEPTPVEPQDATQQELSKFSIPEGATFESATFYIYVKEPNGQNINLHRITSPWNELNPDGVTWNTEKNSRRAPNRILHLQRGHTYRYPL